MTSADLGTIHYTVDIDTGKLVSSSRLAEQSVDKLDRKLDESEKTANNAAQGMSRLAKAIGAVVAASAIRDMAQLVQSYQEMAERVRMASASQDEFEMVQRRLLATANGTYRSLGEAQELYIRTAASLRSMGYETAQALDVTDSMSYAFVKNATAADRASAATVALSKSINTGKVAADSWESITSAIPTVIEDIAAASGKTAAEIRALGAAGDLTARQLTEGLRKSLDANAKAAADMSNNLTDAAVRSRTALTQVLVALEEQTGALQTFTNGIIMAADAMLEFGGDATSMANVLAVLQGAAAATAAVVAGRLLTALGSGTAALYAATIGAANKARADLQAAQNATAHAAQNLILARSAEQAAVGLSTHTAAARNLAAAEATATAATANLATAQQNAARVATIATTAMAGLRGAMAFLGGPTGVILLAATALYTFTSRANEARVGADQLAKSVNDLGSAQLELQRTNLAKDITDFSGEVEASRSRVERLTLAIKNLGEESATGNRADSLREEKARLEELEAAQNARIKREKEITAELERRRNIGSGSGATTPGTGSPAEPTTSADGQKRLAEMRDELELAKLTGEARIRLQAIQKLGAEATQAERDEAARLASEIYRLEEAQKQLTRTRTESAKADTKSADELTRETAKNAEAVKALAVELSLANLKGRELAEAKELLKLNEYATPEEIEQVRALAAELERVQQAEAARKAIGDDPAKFIRGDVTPLSGGMFDDQTARYEAEGQAEQERYAAQLERLRQAKAAEVEVIGGYQALEERMAQEHAGRMQQIEAAKNQALLQSGANVFGSLADATRQFAGEQSGIYKTMFAASKAFAIAQSIIAIQQGIAQAAANPWPANIGAMASVAAATAGLVSNIASVTLGGGRQYGGPVSSGSAYRINENGAPEILNSANGRQYLLPNTRGQVVSNKDAGGGAGITNYVTISIDGSGNTASSSSGSDPRDAQVMAEGIRAVVIDELYRQNQQGGALWEMRNNA